MNKHELVKHIAKKNEYTQNDAENVLNVVLEGIRTAFETEEEISIVGWGRFYKKIVPERKGRNPATGEGMQIPAYMKVSLKAGKGLIDAASLTLKPAAKKTIKKKR